MVYFSGSGFCSIKLYGNMKFDLSQSIILASDLKFVLYII